jgi:hypothetical protein
VAGRGRRAGHAELGDAGVLSGCGPACQSLAAVTGAGLVVGRIDAGADRGHGGRPLIDADKRWRDSTEPLRSRRSGMVADHDHGAGCVLHAVLADRAEQRFSEAAVPAAARHEQIGTAAGIEQYPGGVALSDLGCVRSRCWPAQERC